MIILHGFMHLDDLLLWCTIGYPPKCKTDLTMTLTGGRGMPRYGYSFLQDSV